MVICGLAPLPHDDPAFCRARNNLAGTSGSDLSGMDRDATGVIAAGSMSLLALGAAAGDASSTC